MVFSPAISALQSSLGAGKALRAAQVKVNEEEGVDADKSLDTYKVKICRELTHGKVQSSSGL